MIPLLLASAFNPGDDHFSDVVILLPLDTASGSPVITDTIGHTWTTNNLSLSSAEHKVGTGSLLFNTSTSWATGPAISLPADFTMECWIYPTSIPSSWNCFISQWSQGSAPQSAFTFGINSSAQFTFDFGPASTNANIVAGGYVTTNTWYNVAVTRQSSTFRLFVNGTIVSTGTSALAGSGDGQPVTLGNYYDGAGFPATGAVTFQGYMQQVRITNGLARYTANYTPSTEPFPTN